MQSFHKTFKNHIDMTNGTVVLNEETYKAIQKNALEHAIKIVTNVGEYGLDTKTFIVLALRKEISSL